MSWQCENCEETVRDSNECYYCGRSQPDGELTPSQLQAKVQELEKQLGISGEATEGIIAKLEKRIKRLERELGL